MRHYSHNTIHRVSMERDLRHDVAGCWLDLFACGVLFIVAFGLLLIVLSIVTHGTPDPGLP
jgi:hypothetical protein